jgi:WD40 repeat protein/uncharacterized caspase-like protein
MAKNRAIAIGVNRYDFLPQLSYAQQDAQAIQTFLNTKAGFEQVFLFSDDSPPISGKSTHPSRANLLRVLRQAFESPSMEAGDNFWFFFSGHGIRHQEQDYLLPTDGDPEDVENTAISIHYITERLRRCGADNIVFVLDACRNQSRRDGQGIGYQTAEIARQAGVVSLFSCSPNESSYEVDELQQGIFTAALLEGLGQAGHCATVESLDHYLLNRVPELSRQHHRPRQTPYVVAEPLIKRHLILLPHHATSSDVATLKNEAYRVAQISGNLELSEQLWIRVLAVSSGQDMEAIKALQHIAQLRMGQAPPLQTTSAPESHSSSVSVLTAVRPIAQQAEALQANETATKGESAAEERPDSLFADRAAQNPAFQGRSGFPLSLKFLSFLTRSQPSVHVLTGHAAPIRAIAISADGRWLASGSHDQTIKLWDLQSGVLQQTFEGHTNLVTTVTLSAAGNRLISGSGDNTLKLWDCRTGRLIKTLSGHSGWVLAIALSPDGKTLASGSADGSIKLWNLETGQERWTLTGHLGWVRSVAISPDGAFLVSGSDDQMLKLWSLKTGELLETFSGHGDRVSFVAFSPDGQKLVSASTDQSIKLWHLKKRKLLRSLTPSCPDDSADCDNSLSDSAPLGIALSPNGKWIASAHGCRIELWHLDRGKRFRTLVGHRDRISAIAFNPNGKLLLSGSDDHTIRVWHTQIRQAWTRIALVSAALVLGWGGLQLYGNHCEPYPSDLPSCLFQQPLEEVRESLFPDPL